MKSLRYLLIIGVVTGMTLTGNRGQSQDTDPGQEGLPDEKWDVKKEYDEQGNLIYYDSTYSWSWKHFDFPEFEDGCPFGNIHPFDFGSFSWFMDSLDGVFYHDSSFFHRPHGFKFFKDYPDSSRMESFFHDFLFPDASRSFEDFFPPDHFSFGLQPFGDPHELLEKHHEWLQRFRQEFAFPSDSLHHFHPYWQQLPQHRKKSARGIEI